MRTRRIARPHRGSTLLLALILLGVLSVIAVSAVALSSQERVNAATKSRRDALAACAAAAQGALWAELLRYGPRYLGSLLPAGKIELPDGTVLSMGHYDQEPSVTLVSQTVRPVACDAGQAEEFVDLTNRDAVLRVGGHCYKVAAHCKDTAGRELEIEFGINTLF
jgi:hypothetical protein